MKIKMLVSSLMGMLLLAAVGTASAKIEGTAGGGGTTTACSPISSLTAKGDPRVGEIGLASVQMGWSVKPCSNTQTVRVVATITNWNTKEVVYTDVDAGLNGKVLIFVAARYIYDCTVTVFDAVTGELLGIKTFGASTIPKGV